jgi:hypothetical protein
VSKGPGVWQKEILRVTSGVCVATVSGIVRARLPEPHRDAFVAARRGARGLALAQRVSAVYAYACVRCGQIQDRDDPVACCGSVRPMLAVCQPERRRLLLHPAPPPGGRAPAWINVAVVPSRPQGQFPVPGIADLAALALRRCYERLEAGEAAVPVQDAVAAMRLAWQIEHDEAIPARDKALADLAEAQAAVLSLKDAIIRRSGLDEWRALWGEVRKERERAREFRKARQRFVMAARRVH